MTKFIRLYIRLLILTAVGFAAGWYGSKLFSISEKNVATQTAKPAEESATGEWRWEKFSEDEIQKWSKRHFVEVYWLKDRWKQNGWTRVLDVGAGQGHDSILFAQNGFAVSSLDINQFSMDRLAKMAAVQKLNIKTFVADATKMPFADGAFDAVWANQVVDLSGCDNIQKIISEMCRVVKPDGEIYFTLNYNGEDEAKQPHDKRGTGGNDDNDRFNTDYCGTNAKTLPDRLGGLNVIDVLKATIVDQRSLKDKVTDYYIVATCKRPSNK